MIKLVFPKYILSSCLYKACEFECPKCGKLSTVHVKASDLDDYYCADVLVQEAFPYLPSKERELFVSGLCGECWDKLFKDSDPDIDNLPFPEDDGYPYLE